MPSTVLEPQALASALLQSKSTIASTIPSPDDTSSNPVSRTSSGSSISSVATSGEDSPSVFSTRSHPVSTGLTTPAGSLHGNKDSVEAITIASSSRPRTISAGARSVASSSSTHSDASTIGKAATAASKQPRQDAKKLVYTDEDWAKDVRWLAPPRMPAASSPTSTRRHSRILPPDFHLPLPDDPPAARRPGRQRGKGDRRSKRSRNSRGRMSALWEEDESEECSTSLSSTEPSRASTPIPETPPHSLPTSPLGKSVALQVAGAEDEHTPSESTHSESTPDTRLQRYAHGQRRSHSTTSSMFRSGASGAHLPTHALPNPPPAASPSGSGGGYTGLTLPHAGYSNAKGKASADGHVDLVRAGVAQSSMATIEVIRGVAATVSGAAGSAMVPSAPGKGKPRRAGLFTLGRSFSISLRAKKRESATPVHLQGGLPLPVAFTAHVSPPSYVPESHVLVQVHAVGLDSLDSLIVHEKSGMSGNGGGVGGGKGIGGGKAGFIPGRSFVGKVVECGWAVREEVCKRNDWVIGLLDAKKVRNLCPCL